MTADELEKLRTSVRLTDLLGIGFAIAEPLLKLLAELRQLLLELTDFVLQGSDRLFQSADTLVVGRRA